MSRTKGPVETLCWEHRDHVAQQGQAPQGRGVAGLGLAGRVQHFQGFLPSIMLLSLQPKPICNEGVESLKHKQEALSKKKSLFSVGMPVQSCQKNKKASPPAKEQALTPTALELPPTVPVLQETGTELSSFLRSPHSAPPSLEPWGRRDPPRLTQQLRVSSTHPPHSTAPAPQAPSHRCSLWSCHSPWPQHEPIPSATRDTAREKIRLLLHRLNQGGTSTRAQVLPHEPASQLQTGQSRAL